MLNQKHAARSPGLETHIPSTGIDTATPLTFDANIQKQHKHEHIVAPTHTLHSNVKLEERTCPRPQPPLRIFNGCEGGWKTRWARAAEKVHSTTLYLALKARL